MFTCSLREAIWATCGRTQAMAAPLRSVDFGECSKLRLVYRCLQHFTALRCTHSLYHHSQHLRLSSVVLRGTLGTTMHYVFVRFCSCVFVIYFDLIWPDLGRSTILASLRMTYFNPGLRMCSEQCSTVPLARQVHPC